jgi:hypothetical protein
MIGVRHIIDTMMDEIDKKLKAEKQIKRARQEIELEEKEIKGCKHGARNVKR